MREVKLTGPDGTEVTVSVNENNFDEDQSDIVERLFDAQTPSILAEEEWERVRDLMAVASGSSGPDAFIVRFDWTWIKIDERRLSYEDAIKLK